MQAITIYGAQCNMSSRAFGVCRARRDGVLPLASIVEAAFPTPGDRLRTSGSVVDVLGLRHLLIPSGTP